MSERAQACEFRSDALIVRVDVTIAGAVRAIDPAVEQVMRAVAAMGCAQGREFEIETALREALANAIVHGCKGNPARTVNVTAGCDSSRGMIIVVRDPGDGFDPSALPNPVLGERIFESHGRGIYLINRLMDEVRFGRRGTEIWMRKG